MDSSSRCAALERRIVEHEARIMSLEKSLAELSAKFAWLNSQCELTHFEPFPSSPASAAHSQYCHPTPPSAAPDTAQDTVIDTFSMHQPKSVHVQQSPTNNECELAVHVQQSPTNNYCELAVHVQQSPSSSTSDMSDAEAYMSPDWEVFQPPSMASKRAASDIQPTQRKLF